MLVRGLIKLLREQYDSSDHIAVFTVTSRDVRVQAKRLGIRINPRESEKILAKIQNQSGPIVDQINRLVRDVSHDFVRNRNYIARGGDTVDDDDAHSNLDWD